MTQQPRALTAILVDGDPLALPWICRTCGKDIFWPMYCYRCATGREPTRRQAERVPFVKRPTRYVDTKLKASAADARRR